MARRRILFFIAGVIGVACAVGLAPRLTHSTGDEFTFDAAKLTDTAVWTKVNSEPYRIGDAVAFLCARPTGKPREPEKEKSPHDGYFITVYVNNAGREAMFAKEAQTFPQGSMIVKEKIPNRTPGSKPALYTIMRKREAGFNPSVGDWEFAVVGSNGKEIQAIGKLENCQSCHKPKRDSDFVFRPYLPSN
jgi:hypothetical protein